MSIYSKDRALSGAIHYLSGRAVGGMASFLTILLMVRYMNTSEYAAYTAMTGLVMLGVNISSLGLERAIARYVPDGIVNNRLGQVVSFIHRITLYRALAAIVFALGTALLWQPLTELFGMQQGVNNSSAMIALAVVGGGIFQIQSAVLQSLMRQQLLARVMAVQWGSRLLLTLYFIYAGRNIDLPQAMLILAVPEGISAAVAHLAISARVRVHPVVGSQHDQAPWPESKGFIEVSGYNYLYNLLAIPPQGAIMRLVISAFCPPQFVAAYGFFQSLVEKARQYLPTQLLYMLIEPLLIAKYMEHGNIEMLRQRTHFLYVMNLLVLVPAIAIVAGCGESLTAVLTGGRYIEYWWLLIPALIQLVLSSQIVLQKIALTALDLTLRLILAAILGLLFYGITLFLTISNEADNALPFIPLTYFAVVIGYLSLHLRKSNCDVGLDLVLWLKIFLLGTLAAAAAYLPHAFTASALMNTSAAVVATLAIFAVGSVMLGIVTRQDLALLHTKRNNKQ